MEARMQCGRECRIQARGPAVGTLRSFSTIMKDEVENKVKN